MAHFTKLFVQLVKLILLILVMVGEILDLRLQVDNAVVRHVRHFLYIAVLAELISVGEITTIFLPVNPRKLLWRIECSFVIAVRKLTFVLLLLGVTSVHPHGSSSIVLSTFIFSNIFLL